MSKERYTFITDNQDVIEFIRTLGRKRSKVIEQLLLDCMEDGQGFVSSRIMYETGFSYSKKVRKNQNKVKKHSFKKPNNTNTEDKKDLVKNNITLLDQEKEKEDIDNTVAISINNEIENVSTISNSNTNSVVNILDKNNDINLENQNDNEMPVNTELLSAGLSAFGL